MDYKIKLQIPPTSGHMSVCNVNLLLFNHDFQRNKVFNFDEVKSVNIKIDHSCLFMGFLQETLP